MSVGISIDGMQYPREERLLRLPIVAHPHPTLPTAQDIKNVLHKLTFILYEPNVHNKEKQ